jgi:hypothetical protein
MLMIFLIILYVDYFSFKKRFSEFERLTIQYMQINDKFTHIVIDQIEEWKRMEKNSNH